jgi:hypothetical protein
MVGSCHTYSTELNHLLFYRVKSTFVYVLVLQKGSLKLCVLGISILPLSTIFFGLWNYFDGVVFFAFISLVADVIDVWFVCYVVPVVLLLFVFIYGY